MGYVAAKGEVTSNAASPSSGQRLAPTGFVRSKLQHGSKLPRIERLPVRPHDRCDFLVLGQQAQAKLAGVFASSVS